MAKKKAELGRTKEDPVARFERFKAEREAKEREKEKDKRKGKVRGNLYMILRVFIVYMHAHLGGKDFLRYVFHDFQFYFVFLFFVLSFFSFFFLRDRIMEC